MGMGYQWLETSPCCLYCGANGHWAAYCERRVAAVKAVIKSAEAASGGTQIMESSSGRRENRADESGPDREAGAELDRGKKRVGFGRMFDLRENWKEVTDSIKKRGEGASWQLTADWRKRDVEEPTARSELRSSEGQSGAETNPRKRVASQAGAAKYKGEKSKRDKAEVLVTVSEAVQLAQSHQWQKKELRLKRRGYSRVLQSD